MSREERELALYCLKASSDYHSEVCEKCINYPNCDHTIQDDVTETIIKALEQEPCEDVISREYLFKVLDDFCGHDRTATITLDTLADLVYDMPSVKPQEPKTGHWKIIPFGNNHGEYRPKEYVCSECGWKIDLCRGLQQDTGHRLFCEHCGADMRKE